jgi:predicted nucleic acid-binding protein
MQRWFDRILASYSSRILAFDQQAALVAANLHLNRTHPKDDARIAAIAISHGLSVATRNTKDFEDLPVTVFDPFEYHAG